jgi:hypothetical protein
MDIGEVPDGEERAERDDGDGTDELVGGVPGVGEQPEQPRRQRGDAAGGQCRQDGEVGGGVLDSGAAPDLREPVDRGRPRVVQRADEHRRGDPDEDGELEPPGCDGPEACRGQDDERAGGEVEGDEMRENRQAHPQGGAEVAGPVRGRAAALERGEPGGQEISGGQTGEVRRGGPVDTEQQDQPQHRATERGDRRQSDEGPGPVLGPQQRLGVLDDDERTGGHDREQPGRCRRPGDGPGGHGGDGRRRGDDDRGEGRAAPEQGPRPRDAARGQQRLSGDDRGQPEAGENHRHLEDDQGNGDLAVAGRLREQPGHERGDGELREHRRGRAERIDRPAAQDLRGHLGRALRHRRTTSRGR